MDKSKITNYTELQERILFLKSEKLNQEEKIGHLFKDIVLNFNLVSMMRGSLNEGGGKKNIVSRLVKIGLNLASDFIINLVFGKRCNFKSFLKSLFAETFSVLLINSNISKIVSVVGRFLYSSTENRTN